MGRERKSNPRKMRPQFLVLCEGETEEFLIFPILELIGLEPTTSTMPL